MREVTPDEADCLGLDEKRQLNASLPAGWEAPKNYEEPTPLPPGEVPTEPPWEPEEPSRDDVDIGTDAVEQENSVINRNRRTIKFVEETWREY